MLEMSVWGKILGGGTGMVLGGPLGAILGLALGHKIDKIRKQLNTNRFTKPLFSTTKFTRNIEKAYCEIYKRFVNNQIIEDIVIK